MRTALIVEDDKATIEAHTVLLDDLGYHTVAAQTISEAKKLVQNHPCFELVISDLNFADAAGHANLHGKEFGEWLRRMQYPSFLAVHSAHYNERSPEYTESATVFDFQLRPGADFEEYERLAKTAAERRNQLLEKSKLVISPEAAKQHPALLEKVHTLKDPHAEGTDSDFFSLGYAILSVQPTVQGQVVGAPFFVWQKNVDGGEFVEVYGQPTLLGFGSSIDDALEVLNEVMYSTFMSATSDDTVGRMSEVIKFLHAIYRAEWNTA